jgi:hypothetical protein
LVTYTEGSTEAGLQCKAPCDGGGSLSSAVRFSTSPATANVSESNRLSVCLCV